MPLLKAHYEQLVAGPEPWIRRIEDFTAIRHIERAVMSRKFNTFRGPAQFGYSPTEYIRPVPLTDGEVAPLQEHAVDVLTEERYTSQPAAAPALAAT